LIAVGAVLAVVSGVALLVMGATDSLGAVLAVSGGVWVAAVGSVLLIGRSLRRSQRGERPS
jgi:hypothetical protein